VFAAWAPTYKSLLGAAPASGFEEDWEMTNSDREYSEPTKDVVTVIIVLSISCILLAIALAGLFLWLPQI
jgi:hypothetical protein